jgi:DNA-binding MarR family transcriptional regulator
MTPSTMTIASTMFVMANSRLVSFDPIEEAHRQWLVHEWEAAPWMVAATALMRMQQMVLKRVDSALRPLQLTFARYEALTLLYFSRRGSLPLGKMGDRLMVHPASVTNAIDRLEEDGFARRTRHPTDRRAVLAEITPAGRKVVDRATDVLVGINFGLDELTEREADQLSELIRGFREQAGDLPATEAPSARPRPIRRRTAS